METIHKYELAVTDHQQVSLPNGYEILTIQMQHGKPCLWVKIDPERTASEVKIIIRGTGHQFTDNDVKYISTFQMNDGDLVFHAFIKD